MPATLYFLFLFVAEALATNSTKGVRDETRLRAHLFDDYDKLMRPVANYNDTLRVSIAYMPLNLIDLDEAHQKFSMYGLLVVNWTAYDLTWDSTDYGGADYIAVSAEELWIPDLAITNSVDQPTDGILGREDRYMKLFSDGVIVLVRPGATHTICLLDMTYFPFDEQVCHIELESWTLHLPEIDLIGSSSSLLLQTLKPSGQWDFVDTYIHERISSGIFKTLSLVFKLKRKPLYVSLYLFLPVLGIMLLQLTVFCIPPDAGEKISLGLTLLLAQTVFQLVVQQNIPETSDQTPIFSVYILLSMLISGFEVICSVIVLRCHHRPTEDIQSKSLLEKLILKVVGKRRCQIEDRKIEHEPQGSTTEINRIQGTASLKGIDWQNIAGRLDHTFFIIFSTISGLLVIIVVFALTSSPNTRSEPLQGFGYSFE